MSRVNNINIGEKTTSQNKSIITPKTIEFYFDIPLKINTRKNIMDINLIQ